jgi:hypothetical protein
MTSGREINSHASVNKEGVCDHAEVERARGRPTAMDVEGVDSLEARLEGEDFGEEESSGGSNWEGWERVETIFIAIGIRSLGRIVGVIWILRRWDALLMLQGWWRDFGRWS